MLYGGDGNDLFVGGPGADLIFGYEHDDKGDGTSYLTSWGGVQVDLTGGTSRGGDAEGDRLVRIEHVQGSWFDDDIRGTTSANYLSGWGGDDILRGGAGGC